MICRFFCGYILSDSKKSNCNLTIIATGSEVEIALEVQKKLNEKNIESKVVSMPCLELFEKQSQEYKNKIPAVGWPINLEMD